MARYPTFEEYQKRGNFQDGIKRCNDLLKKSPNDVQLLTLKLQFTYATKGDAEAILDQLLSIRPPLVLLDLRDLVAIEETVIKSQSDVFPQPKTAAPQVAKLWENAFKASESMNNKLDILSLRFSQAIVHNRMADAQQSLIQLKGLQPKKRSIYMAHAAVTQLLSASKDDLQARLALSLARKAVTERFDDDNSLDCRVPGQIFALQVSTKDLDSIANRSFKESKQAHNALHKLTKTETNGAPPASVFRDPTAVPPLEWLSAEVETLKKRLAELMESSSQLEAVSAFAANSIRLFHTTSNSTSYNRGRGPADTCFLSISALVRAYEMTDDLSNLVQAAYLAETLLKQNTHIHEARMILIYLYMRLGLGSLAMQYFDSLSVKEIQHDTVGHAPFTRLSFIHPHSTKISKNESLNPFKRTTQALAVYTRHEEKLAESEASVLSHEQTGMIFDLHELRDSLRSSLSRRITHLEQRRLGRLIHDNSGEDTAQMGPRVTANWLECTDNRDFAATFNFGYNVEKVLHGRNGQLPGKYWILNSLAIDSAWCLAMGFQTPVIDPENITQELTNIALDFDCLKLKDSGASSLGMSDAEYLAGDLACQVLKMLAHLATSTAELSGDVNAASKAVARLNVDALVEMGDVLAEHLMDHYVYLDVLRVVVRACTSASKQSKECDDELRKLLDDSKVYYGAIQTHANDQLKRVNAKDVRAVMERDGSTWEVIKMFGHDGVQTFSELVAASIKEGWEGVAKIELV